MCVTPRVYDQKSPAAGTERMLRFCSRTLHFGAGPAKCAHACVQVSSAGALPGQQAKGCDMHTAVERGGNCQPASAVDQHGNAGPGAWHMPQAVRHASVVLPAQSAGGGMSRSSHACVLLPLVAGWSLHVPPAWPPCGCFADHCCHGSSRGLVVAWITGHTPCTGATVV